MGVTVKKCHMIMSGNDCWNSVCFSCCRKADNELADVTLSSSMFQNCAAVGTGNKCTRYVEMELVRSIRNAATVTKIFKHQGARFFVDTV